jgi:hypothetical protein
VPKRVITVANFVRDIRAGMTDTELMDKYNLDALGLENAIGKMIKIKALSQEEWDARIPILDEPSEIRVSRALPRKYVYFSLPVYAADDLAVEGSINDISENGLQIAGIRTEVGETRTFLVKPDEFDEIYPFAFDAICRWSREDDEAGDWVGGFEITDISPAGQLELRKLIDSLSL